MDILRVKVKVGGRGILAHLHLDTHLDIKVKMCNGFMHAMCIYMNVTGKKTTILRITEKG